MDLRWSFFHVLTNHLPSEKADHMPLIAITTYVETGPGVTRADITKLTADTEKYQRVVLLRDNDRFVSPQGDDELPRFWHQHKGKDGCSYCKNEQAVDGFQSEN